MGSIWLVNIPDWLEDAGLPYRLYKGWETRARSSGGYDDVRGVGYHHDATSPSSNPASAEAYMWDNADSRPIGALYIRRDGSITVGAAGATNTMGKGGPLTTSQGSVPLDKGNQYMVAIEAANNGVGEPWSRKMLDAYFTLCAVLCDRLGLKASDCFSHWEYCNPSCPGRKIDPAGPTPDYPDIGGTSGAKTWSTPAFRSRVSAVMGEEDDEVTQDDINKIVDAVWKRKVLFKPTNKEMSVEDLLEWVAQYAANADRQTRAGDPLNSVAEEVWGHSKRTLTG